jgi:hypothetical protein
LCTAGEILSEDWDLRHRKLYLQIAFGEEAQAKGCCDLSSDVLVILMGSCGKVIDFF